MKKLKQPFNFNIHYILVFAGISLIVHSCDNKSDSWVVPDNLIGTWKTDEFKVTVRTEPRWMKFNFTPGLAYCTVSIYKDKTVRGSIGLAAFKKGKIKKNKGNPDRTGITYIIECGSIGKIFNGDPLDYKEVEIWLGHLDGEIDSELRFTQDGAKFPMAGMIFSKFDQ